jgi:hypothetical protein
VNTTPTTNQQPEHNHQTHHHATTKYQKSQSPRAQKQASKNGRAEKVKKHYARFFFGTEA